MTERPRRIWLTGASSGLGEVLARLLLEDGAHVAVSARSVEPLRALAARYPGRVMVLAGDLCDSNQVNQMAQQLHEQWGALDTVILNAGTCEYVDVHHFEAAMVERVMNANLFSASHCIEAALPLLRLGQTPHLVGVCSAVTFLPLTRSQAYGASKIAFRYLLESLRVDLAWEKIDVTVVSPGFIDTPLTRRNDFPMPMIWSAEKAGQYVHRRLARHPLEIAFPPVFLAVMRLLSYLPAWAQLQLGKRMVRSSAEHKDVV